MVAFDVAFVVFYFIVLLVLGFYGSHRYLTARRYRAHRHETPTPAAAFEVLPKVTIQLPIYNERYVVERLIQKVCQIRYPLDRLEIQVLDDSTDDTTEVARRCVDAKHAAGFPISYIHRTNRAGFKAGALDEGLKQATGEFIAVFDADFLPEPDFLEQTVHFFTDEKIGMVQIRWDHINRNFSLLTQAQAVLLDGHFILEHTARNRSGRFFNFNGTAGMWRREAISDAGGWEHDTLTEDLDLSYRAQSKGWRFVYLKDVLAPAELPVEMSAFKSQQHRWAKGSIQVGLKLLPTLLRSDLPRKVKLEAFMHLTNNIGYIFVVMLSLLMPMVTLLRIRYHWTLALFIDLPIFLCATYSIANFYILTQRESGKKLGESLLYLPIVMAMGVGLCVNNARAVVEALLGHETSFRRTPKYGVTQAGETWTHVKYRFRLNWQPFVEVAFGVYLSWSMIACMIQGAWFNLIFQAIFASGFLFVGLSSILQRNRLFSKLFDGRRLQPAQTR
jgi:cellulose synthase/poly-beta-1,6-N-acetylglucosamine synthase-like glycosyltransferase